MTDFAMKVKNELLQRGKTQKWLMEQVGGIYDGRLNSAVMSLAINKENNIYPQVKIAIAHILQITF